MIIRSQEHSYEAIQALPNEGDVLHYLGRERDGWEVHLISMGRGEDLKEFMPILSELDENAAFTDLKEYFLEDGILWMVFPWEKGGNLGEYMAGAASPAERYDLGRQLMEQVILKMMPVYLQQEVLTQERVIVGEDKSPGFYYSFGSWRDYPAVPEDAGNRSIIAVLKVMFKKEEESGLYPEWNTWLASLSDSKTGGVLELYQEYLKLVAVFSVEREKKKRKAKFGERWKKCLPRILAAVKIAAGITVLAVAAAGAVGLWKGKVEPVIQAASMWKAVYVDGKPLESEESETSTEKETEAAKTPEEAENGRGERYRGDGSLSYKGGLKDGLYDDTGTLYYPNGKIDYQGGFAFGKKEGNGCLYTDTGILYYEGEFKKDVFEGQGKLYDGDTGSLIYEGGFSGGKYSGQGVLYDGTTEFPRYVGNFRLGFYDGRGLEYDSTGSLFYEGEFLLGKYHGKGILYDPATGAALEEGMFRNGIFIGPEDGGEEGAGTEGVGPKGEGTEGAGMEGAGTEGAGTAGEKSIVNSGGKNAQEVVSGEDRTFGQGSQSGTSGQGSQSGTSGQGSQGGTSGQGGQSSTSGQGGQGGGSGAQNVQESISSEESTSGQGSQSGTSGHRAASLNLANYGPGMTQAAKKETAPTKEIGPGVQ